MDVDALVRVSEAVTWFSYDRALLAALVDRWYPETHTFHLSCDEMAPTLEDVSLLMDLPCVGDTIGARDVGVGWRDEMLGRFSVVQQMDSVASFRPFPATEKHDLMKAFLIQFVVCMHFNRLLSPLHY